MDDLRSEQGQPDDPRDIGGILSGGLRKFSCVAVRSRIDQSLPAEGARQITKSSPMSTPLHPRRQTSSFRLP